MEEGEISGDSELAPSVLEVPTINWANYIGVKIVQYIKMGHAQNVQALEQDNWDLENIVRETEKEFATELRLLMTETTNNPKLLKTLVCLERQQNDIIPDEYSLYKKTVNTLRISVLRRQNHCATQPTNNRHKLNAQRKPKPSIR